MKSHWYLGIFLILAGSFNSFHRLNNPKNELTILEELANLELDINMNENHYFPEFRLSFYEDLLTKDLNLDYYHRWSYAYNLANAGHFEESIKQYEKVKKEFKKTLSDDDQFYLSLAMVDVYLKKYLRAGVKKKKEIKNRELEKAISLGKACLKYSLTKEYGYDKELKTKLQILKELNDADQDNHFKELVNNPNTHNTIDGSDKMKNITRVAGLAIFNSQAGGGIMDDFNQDGYPDIVSSDMGLKGQLKYFLNDGHGKFFDHTETAGLTGFYSGVNIVQTDFNNDGYLDIFVPRGGSYSRYGLIPNSLFRNNKNNTFTDVTKQAGLLSYAPAKTAIWADFNNDGWLDLFVGNDDVQTMTIHSEFYLNNQDGTFDNVTLSSGLSFRGSVQDVSLLDYNSDGLMDLFIAIKGGSDILYFNKGVDGNGKVNFSIKTQLANLPAFKNTGSCQAKDINNDGWDDLILNVKYTSKKLSDSDHVGIKFFINNQDGTFSEEKKVKNIFKEISPNAFQFIDLDNGGNEDFYMTHSFMVANQTFKNTGTGNYSETNSSYGLAYLPDAQNIAIGDIDLDGDQDIYLITGGHFFGEQFPNQLYENQGHDNNWITVKLIGVSANKIAIGAKVKITIAENGRERKIYKTIQTTGKSGASSLALHFGIAKAERVKSIAVNWPGSNLIQRFENLIANNHYILTEGKEDVTVH